MALPLPVDEAIEGRGAVVAVIPRPSPRDSTPIAPPPPPPCSRVSHPLRRSASFASSEAVGASEGAVVTKDFAVEGREDAVEPDPLPEAVRSAEEGRSIDMPPVVAGRGKVCCWCWEEGGGRCA